MPTNGEVLGACCRGLASMPLRLARPRPRDERLLATIEDAGLPESRGTVRVTALPQGRNTAPTAVIAEGVRRPWRTTLGMTTVLVEHPSARFLVDPAICGDVHGRVLRDLPAVVRLLVQPERPVTPLGAALATTGIGTDDVDFVIATHLHWDHVSGLLDLPAGTPVRTSSAEIAFATAAPPPIGVVPGPLSGADLRPFELDGPPVSAFTASYDVFEDGSVLLVDLAGHTPGSVGVLLTTDAGPVLLAGDSVWHGRQVDTLRQKASFPGVLVDDDRDATFRTLHRLQVAASRGVRIVPAHDREAAASLGPRQ